MQVDRIQSHPGWRLIGLNRSYTIKTRGAIPQQWSEWEYEAISGVTEGLVFGVSHNFSPPDKFDYTCALPVGTEAKVPQGQTEVLVPGGRFAVFVHHGHVSGIATVFDQVCNGPEGIAPGWVMTSGPQLEVYGDDFDPKSASGRVEIWVPVHPRS